VTASQPAKNENGHPSLPSIANCPLGNLSRNSKSGHTISFSIADADHQLINDPALRMSARCIPLSCPLVGLLPRQVVRAEPGKNSRQGNCEATNHEPATVALVGGATVG
jgi:hypothetical protein